jgi:DNA-binding transcriptional regulator YdaS (Cro superfamily)
MTTIPIRPRPKDPILKRIFAAAGGVADLADILGIRSVAVYQWTRVPSARVLGIEKATGISRYEMRPDIYPIEDAPRSIRLRLLKAKGKKSVAKPAKTGKSGRARAA